MTLSDLYRKAVAQGIECDPRGADEARNQLADARAEREALKETDRAWFDAERIENPYADTRILWGEPSQRLQAVMVGIDVDEGEILLADRLRSKGRRIDAVVSHHPRGRALAQLADAMRLQADLHARLGVPIAQAEGILAPRLREVAGRIHPVNHQRVVDAARLLEVPLVCLHTPADNCVASFLSDLFDKEAPRNLGDLLDLLFALPEYQGARSDLAGPVIAAGDRKARAGRVFVDMTGGTEGAKEMYQKFAQATGVSTIVGMHLSKEHVEEAQKNHLNVVIAGHIASDNLGMNLLLDACLPKGMEVIEAAGFRRVQRRAAKRKSKG